MVSAAVQRAVTLGGTLGKDSIRVRTIPNSLYHISLLVIRWNPLDCSWFRRVASGLVSISSLSNHECLHKICLYAIVPFAPIALIYVWCKLVWISWIIVRLSKCKSLCMFMGGWRPQPPSGSASETRRHVAASKSFGVDISRDCSIEPPDK